LYKGRMLVAAVRRAFPALRRNPHYYGFAHPGRDALHRLIRLAIYANDEAEFVAKRDLYDKEWVPDRAVHFLAALLAGVTLADRWLASRRPAIQFALVEAKLLAFLSTGAPDADLPTLIAHSRSRQENGGFDRIRPVLLHYDLLAARLDDAHRDIVAIEGAADDQRRAVEGAIAFLGGNNAAALDCFRDALRLLRKRRGKRKVFLDGLFGVFFLMALTAGIGAEVIHRWASASVRRSAAWDCGFPDASPATQYTAGSFSQPIRRVFGTLVFHARDHVEMPAPGDTRPARLRIELHDLVWEGMYAPIAGAIGVAADRLNYLQFLTIRRYLSLVFATLVTLLLVLAIWS